MHFRWKSEAARDVSSDRLGVLQLWAAPCCSEPESQAVV